MRAASACNCCFTPAATPTRLAVLSRSLDLDPESRLFSDPTHPPIIIGGAAAAPERRAALAAAGAEATALIAKWEGMGRIEPSRPQTSIGAGVARAYVAKGGRVALLGLEPDLLEALAFARLHAALATAMVARQRAELALHQRRRPVRSRDAVRQAGDFDVPVGDERAARPPRDHQCGRRLLVAAPEAVGAGTRLADGETDGPG